MANASNIKVQPMYVYVGSNVKQTQTVTTVGDTAGSLAGKYFIIHVPAGTGHYFWFDDGVVADPVVGGTFTGHAISYTQGASASTIASAAQAVIDAMTTAFNATVSGNVITIENVDSGYSQPARDAQDPSDQTGFGFKVTQLGFAETEIGCLQGNIEASGFDFQTLEIKAHHAGATVLDEKIVGYSKPQLTLTMQEFNKAALKNALVMAGGYTMTAEVSGASELLGWGPNSVGLTPPLLKVRLHPVANDSADTSEDWTIWKASIKLDSFLFSGEEVSTIPLTISMYPDSTKPKFMQYMTIGRASDLG